ncbi:MAG: salicylate hydroxylase (Salicylate 1-monooxygenase)-like protein [Ramlibacter sp.]|nr:salicylate hydroxylase (Salicylate 1-monooxygenase)-like protein [Ramlibacter sp.]
MTRELLVAGGGIAGLAAALAARRAGWEARLFEQAETFSEVGAGIQLGPNVTRILREWKLLQGTLAQQAWRPPHLRARDGIDGRQLASLAFADIERRYGAPYLTLHRADLQAALLAAAQEGGVRLHSGRKLLEVADAGTGVRVRTDAGPEVEAEALVGADGLWSTVRAAVCGAAPPQPTGDLAYRGLVARADLPPGLRGPDVTVWLAPRMHLVSYPVRGGDWVNVVCVVEGRVAGDPRGWDEAAVASELESAVGTIAAEARDLLRAVPAWSLWVLHDRPPVTRAEDLARGRIALLGDAAHPLRPYLAQGAGMAIEDARELERVLAVADERVLDVPTALRRYALSRWQRVAEVQRRSRANGAIFHATGPARWGRNLLLRAQGARLLDQPWLYGA